MSLSELPLGYCTNVHPGRTVAEVLDGLDRFTAPVARRRKRPTAAGLWLADSVTAEWEASGDLRRALADRLAEYGLVCYTLNAFPFGDFHGPRVKENVYLPDWADPGRRIYTERCANLLASLAPTGVDGSISTVPIGFKGFHLSKDRIQSATDQLIQCARRLHQIDQETGKRIRLAIEPEPLCVLETADEAIEFMGRLLDEAGRVGAAEIVREHIGLCYDICHQAVEFEDAADSIHRIDHAGVRINKVHISCALQLDDPNDPAGRDALRRYVEPRYLHQVIGRMSDGRLIRRTDLNEEVFADPGLAAAAVWRIHFHVPVDAERLGPLATTRSAIQQALSAIAKLSYAPHLEVETYTWEVLPDRTTIDLADGLARELAAAEAMIAEVRGRSRNQA